MRRIFLAFLSLFFCVIFFKAAYAAHESSDIAKTAMRICWEQEGIINGSKAD